jgi:hypothetical protein
MRAAERGRSTGRRMVTISITEEAYDGAGRRAMMCGRPRSTGAPSCAFGLDRATIDRLTALRRRCLRSERSSGSRGTFPHLSPEALLRPPRRPERRASRRQR